MSRLIDADAIRLPKGFFEEVDNVPKFYEWLRKQPTVAITLQSDEIERMKQILANSPTTIIPNDTTKTGRWIAHDLSIKDVPTEACSECGMWSYGWNMDYCPNCGARMAEGGDAE